MRWQSANFRLECGLEPNARRLLPCANTTMGGLHQMAIGVCTKKPFARAGNLQMVVTSLVMAIAYWSGANPVLEQPTSSVMPKREPLCSVLASMKAKKHTVWHGAFNGESPKPLQLWSAQNLTTLQRGRPKMSLTKLCVTKGNRYSGKKDALRASQTYSHEFGRAVAKVFKTWLKNK